MQKTEMSQEFKTKEEAEKFVEDSGWKPPEEGGYDFPNIGSATDFKIQEVPANPQVEGRVK